MTPVTAHRCRLYLAGVASHVNLVGSGIALANLHPGGGFLLPRFGERNAACELWTRGLHHPSTLLLERAKYFRRKLQPLTVVGDGVSRG